MQNYWECGGGAAHSINITKQIRGKHAILVKCQKCSFVSDKATTIIMEGAAERERGENDNEDAQCFFPTSVITGNCALFCKQYKK